MKSTYLCPKDLKLKSGEIVPNGSVFRYVGLTETKRTVILYSESLSREVKVSVLWFAMKILGKKAPSCYTMEKWSDNGIAKSVLGYKVEPDGYDQEGFPSWMLVMGLI